MLKQLLIRNIALIDEIVLPFDEGLNILTGETGAGKSIVVDSINMLLGSRADQKGYVPDAIRLMSKVLLILVIITSFVNC